MAERAQLAALADQAFWERYDPRSLSVASAIYSHPPENALVWLRGKDFVAPDRVTLDVAL
jgi:hypothetical protein